MRYEEQDVNQKGEQRHKQGRQKQNEQSEEEARRVRRGMEMGSDRQTQADQCQKRSDGVYDQDRGERLAGSRR